MARIPFNPLKTAAAQAAGTTDLFAGEAQQYGAPVRTVKQVNALLSRTLATHLPGVFAVAGELSNFRVYDRGHAFFTLKEPGAEIPCMMWRDDLNRLKFKPKDGLAVVARGAIKMYEAQGKVQLYVDALFPQGTGGLELAFRQLCDKLKAEGLFEAGRKRRIVRLPQRVAIVTSRSGDVLHDVLTTAYRRYPGLHTMLFPVAVQGAAAAPAIVRAIELLNAHRPELDLILLVRGGGSLEDLWAFNEETVARAIVASDIPIATGIGHEPDTTIADLVGDLRGPTPTGVTELTIPDVAALRREVDGKAALLGRDLRKVLDASKAELRGASLELAQAGREGVRRRLAVLERLSRGIARIEPRHAIAQSWRRMEEAQRRLDAAQRRRVVRARERVAGLQGRLERNTPAVGIGRATDKLEHLVGKLQRAVAGRLERSGVRVGALANQLRVVSPQAVLERGFSITMGKDGRIIRSVEAVANGDVISTRVADGVIKSMVGEPRQGKLF